MDAQRRRQREKRYRNRLRIGYILLALFVLLSVIIYFVTGRIVLYIGFILPVGIIYLIAGLWEKKELKR